MNWLNDANIIYKIYNVNKPNLPLKAYEDLSAFKIYLNDVGLLRKMAELDSNVVIEGNKIFTEFKGALTENYILQMLLTAGLKTNYFSFDNKYEIDYILQNKDRVRILTSKKSLPKEEWKDSVQTTRALTLIKKDL